MVISTDRDSIMKNAQLVALLLVLLPVSAVAGQPMATYTVEFESIWSAATHPMGFPSNPHFSGLIGSTHNSDAVFWATGSVASLGIKNMAETGSKSALTGEVNEAINAGNADKVLSGGGIGNSPGSQRLTFKMSPDYPAVTLVSMLAPSPDWFVGVRGLILYNTGSWVDTMVVELFVYDAGTDSGSSYTSANNATIPQEPIARIEEAPFLVDGVVKSVGTFTFTLQDVSHEATGFFRASGKEIVNGSGDPVVIKGVGLGGWLVPEGYMLKIHAPDGGSPTSIRRQIADLIGEDDADVFFEKYRANHVDEKDIAQIAEWGYDHIRLPFHYNLFFDPDTETFLESGFDLLNRFLEWCRTYNVHVILDMHAAPGAQNDGPISDSDGTARLWTEPVPYQDWTVRIWEEFARRYKDEKLIIGYDLINEPVTPSGVDAFDLRDLYIRLAEAIRAIDSNHILFIEGNFYATDFGVLEMPFDDNMVYAFHKYWNPPDVGTIGYLLRLRDDTNVPLWLGETGENSNPWFHGVVKLMDEHNIGWNWWTHKQIESTVSPLSAPFAPGYEAVLDYWRDPNNHPRPTVAEARAGLFAMTEGLDLDSCVVKPGVLAALFNPDFGTLRIPHRELTIPGTINAADYDIGNHGVTYFDTGVMATSGTPGGGNNGGQYRNDGVDIERSEDPEGYRYNVGWMERLEWLTYSVTVEETAEYDIDLRVASLTGGGRLKLFLNGESIGQDIMVGATGGWQNWESRVLNAVPLPAGNHILRIVVADAGGNLNRMRFTKVGPVASEEEPEAPVAPILLGTYPNPFNDAVRIVFDSPTPVQARLELFDMLGRRVHETAEKAYTTGQHTVTVQAKLAAGTYLFRLYLTDGNSEHVFSRPVILAR